MIKKCKKMLSQGRKRKESKRVSCDQHMIKSDYEKKGKKMLSQWRKLYMEVI